MWLVFVADIKYALTGYIYGFSPLQACINKAKGTIVFIGHIINYLLTLTVDLDLLFLSEHG